VKEDSRLQYTWIEKELKKLREQGLSRTLREVPAVGGKFESGGRTILNFSSNDYLALASNSDIITAVLNAVSSLGAGSGSSRLVSGTLPVHTALEKKLAEFKGYPAALLFGSGYLANLGVIPALVGRDDVVIADRLAHASLIDGAVLSRADFKRFQHNDCGHLARLLKNEKANRKKLVVTESVFSMDGDLAPLKEIGSLCAQYGALLLVDEAHATGVFGPYGSGLVREHGLENKVDISMGTLSKALGSYGGFVACSEQLRHWFINRARSFIYSTALPPSVVAAALEALRILESKPTLGRELLRRASTFRERLQKAGFNTGNSASQIIPIIIGENKKALLLAERLRKQNILATAIRPPSVPEGTARIRLSVTLAHSESDLEQAAEQIIEAARAERLI
jgi:8-amino-7-oxononanoate synthase